MQEHPNSSLANPQEHSGAESKTHSITLINPAFGVYVSHPSPPLWIAYLQAIFRQNNVRVRVVDETAGQKIGEIDTEWAALSVTTPVANDAFRIAKSLKCKVALGGPHVSIFPKESLKYADKIIAGEGEQCAMQIFTSKKRILKSPLVDDLNKIPFPDWHGMPLKKYKSATRKHNYLPVLTSRGCPYNCIFCYKGVFGRRYRYRSPKNVLDEIEHLVDEYGIQEISFIDDSFTLLKWRVEEICNGIIERGIKIDWNCPNGVRVDSVDEKLLKLMHKAGCYQLSFGIESGNQKVIDKIEKNINLEQVKEAIARAKAEGIETIGFLMIGLPFDNEETMQQTIDLAKELRLDYTQFTIATPYPGTRLYDYVKKNGKFLITDWDKYGSYSGRCYYEVGELNKDLVEGMYKKAMKEIYLRPGYIAKKIIKNPKLLKEGLRFAANLLKKD